MSVAPWSREGGLSASERADVPAMLRVLRGDFFCMPFGGNERPYAGVAGPEFHPPHGDPANRVWRWEAGGGATGEAWLRLSLLKRNRPATIEKVVRLVAGHPVVYQRHTVTGMFGPMCFGHHAMLRFAPGEVGRVSLSAWSIGRVYPGAFEEEARGGRQSLEPGAWFEDLASVPMQDGGSADLTTYPARDGYEDLVQIASAEERGLGWSAVSVARGDDAASEGGWVWFGLKHASALRTTVLWHSNGGREYAPWHGRHRRVLGIEEATAHFHDGIAESAGDNDWTARGVPTCHRFRPDVPYVVPYAFGCVTRPAGFGRVATIEPGGPGVVLTDEAGRAIEVAVDLDWLSEAGDVKGDPADG
jgi:hypothetical protein